jgi:hypothetical protein
VRGRGRNRPSLTLEQRRRRFFDRERHDFEVWPRLTPRQRRSPYWREREAQWQNAGKIGLLLHLAGEEPPEPLARALAPPPPIGSPSGSFTDAEARQLEARDPPADLVREMVMLSRLMPRAG